MGDRSFACPVPRAETAPKSMKAALLKLDSVSLKWRALAERRRDHFFDLYQTGRWKLYYKDNEFLDAMNQAIAIADRWAVIAPKPGEIVTAAKVAKAAAVARTA